MNDYYRRMIKCVGREIGLRKNVYPKFVKRGKMTQEEANDEIKAMEAVYIFLRSIERVIERSADLSDFLVYPEKGKSTGQQDLFEGTERPVHNSEDEGEEPPPGNVGQTGNMTYRYTKTPLEILRGE